MRYRVLFATIFAMASVLMIGPGLLQAQEASPSAAGGPILEAYGRAWSSGEAAQVAALYTEDAVREDVPTSTTYEGRAEIEALAAGLFATDDDARLEVTDGFVGETWAIVEWTFSGARKDTGGEVTFRGASVLELDGGQISRETDYYDLPQMQQQIAAAGGTPAALETLTGDTDATPDAATAGQTGSVTVRVFACPAQLSQAAGQGQPDRAALLAGCTSLDAPETAPTLRALPDGEPMAGTATQPGVYSWDGLAFGDYAIGGSG